MKTINSKYKLFGRFKGRKKIPNLLIKELEHYKIQIKKDINEDKFNILDIGSGSGENAIFLADINKEALIITCELFEDGNINLINQITSKKIYNISMYQGNVLQFLDSLRNVKIFNEVWILFPDPWPKNRHHKRRLINSLFLKKIYFFLKQSGKLMIATDSQSYIQSILSSIYESKNLFYWENQRFEKWDYRFLDLPKTKFYKKSVKSGRNSMFFQLNKI